MKIYNSYQEAKIENPDKAIIRFNRQDEFKAVGDDDLSAYLTTWTKCDAADYCKTLGWLRANHGLERGGDVIIGHSSGDVITITHDRIADYDDNCFLLRAAALENQMNIDKVETQTEHQEEMSAFKSNPTVKLSIDELDKFDSEPDSAFASINDAIDSVEWNGEGLPPVGVECEFKDGDTWYEVKVKYLSEWFMVIEALKSQSKRIDIKGTELSFEYSMFDSLEFRKPETPQQREDRERLESAYDLYESAQHEIDCIGYDSFELFKKSEVQVKFWLAIVDKTNYRKGVK